uniref:SWIRM domain-containing protein n=2 Tax=Plectus sambesii TaxID=2011161 RepID=A0A914UIM0_9BILA
MSSWQRTGRPSDQLVAHMMMTMKDNIEILSHEDDDIALEGATTHCRLPHDKLTSQELACFPDIARLSRATHAVFLYLRNKTLQIWLLNPRDELTFTGLLNEIPAPYNSDTNLVRRVHGFLERYGYINFGFIRPDSAVPKTAKQKRKVVILGAGAAGLAAARQLKGFGCEVVILEARNRVGGRIATYKKGNYVADLGAMIVTGLAGNPVTVLARQMPMTLQKIKTRCPIYDASGKLIDKEKDDVIEKEFNRLLDACAYLAHTKGITDIEGEKLSLGSTFDIIFQQQGKRVREKKLEFWQTYCELQDKQREIQDEMISLKETISKLHAEYSRSMNENENTENVPLLREFQSRCRRRDLQAAIRVRYCLYLW